MKNAIKIILIIEAGWSFVYSIIHAINDPDSERWFTRVCMCIFCLAMYGIIEAIEERRQP
jgi:hypothetical protein